MPKEAVLGTEHPVGLVGEIEVAGVETAELGSIVGCHALRGDNAEVELAMDDTEGGVPFVDEEVGGVGIGVGGLGVLFPVGAAEVPVGEPVFFGFETLLFEVEHAVVGEEGFEAVVLVVAGEPVDTVAAERGAAGTDAVGIDLGHVLGKVVGGSHVVFHAESAIVAADFFTPGSAEAGASATVGCDDEVAGAAHDFEIPAGAPELADHALGTAFAEEECGIGLGAVVVVGIDEPYEHFFAVGGGNPMFLGATHADLGEDFGVDGGELPSGLVFGIELIVENLGGVLHGDFIGVDVVAFEGEAVDVVAGFGDLTDGLGVDIEGEDFVHAAIHDDGCQLAVVVAPGDAADTVVEVGGVVGALIGGEIENHEAQFVALVAVVFHAFPCDAFAVVAEDGVLVVAHDAVADVDGGAVGDGVDKDVAVGAESIVFAGFGAAGVGYTFAVGREVELFNTAPRAHGALVGLGADNVDDVAQVNGFLGEGSEEDVGVFVDPVVPVAVHEVFVDAASGLGQPGIETVDGLGTFDGEVADVKNLVAFGGDFEALETRFDGGENLLGLTIDIHGNDGVATGEEDGVVVEPYGVELAFGGVGDADGLRVVGDREEVEFGIAFVLGNVVVGVGIDQTGAVGAEGVLAHFAKLPHEFGSEAAVLYCCHRFSDDAGGILLFVFAACNQKECGR